jgi:hypothetical protein
MADFAKWVVACEPALPWPSGGFIEVYDTNRSDAVALMLEGNYVVDAVRQLLQDRTAWTGTATELLSALNQIAQQMLLIDASWPKNPKGLSDRLRRDAASVEHIGLKIVFGKRVGKAGTRTITIRRVDTIEAVSPDTIDAVPSEHNKTQTSEAIAATEETQITWKTIDISDLGKGLYSEIVVIDPKADAFTTIKPPADGVEPMIPIPADEG